MTSNFNGALYYIRVRVGLCLRIMHMYPASEI